MQPVPRIFVSATSRDLRTARGLVAEGIRRMECLPIVQDDFPPDYKSVRDMLRTKISACNAVVHLAGFYYGAEPQPVFPGPDRRSFTQMEYEIAMELKMPCYVFLCGRDFPFDPHDPEPEEKQQLQLAHRDRLLKRDELFYEFASPEELANRTRELQLSVENLREELAKERGRRRLAMIAAASALVLSMGGGAYFYQNKQKTDAVNEQQGSEIAALKAQLEGPWAIVNKVNAAMDGLAKESSASPDELKRAAVAMVAGELQKTPEEIERAIEATTTLAQKLIAAARAEGDRDASKRLEARKLEAETLSKLAKSHYASGRYKEALAAYKQRLDLLDKETQPEEWLDAVVDIADAENELAKNDAARADYEQAVAFGEKHPKLGPGHASTIFASDRYASFLRFTLVKLPEAEKFLRRTLELRTKVLGDEHPDTLVVTGDLGDVLAGQGKIDAALELAQRALKVSERVLGPDAPGTIDLVQDVAAILRKKGEYKASIALYERGYLYKKKTRGAEAQATLASGNLLAGLYQQSGDLKSAEKLYRYVLEKREKTLGPDHPSTILSVARLATCLSAQKDFENGEKLMRRAISGSEKAVGAEHPDTLNYVSDLARMLSDQEDFEGAEKLLVRVAEGRARSLGGDHSYTINALSALGANLYNRKKFAEAIPYYRRALKGSEVNFGAKHRDTADLACDLADSLSEAGQREEAISLMSQAVSIASEVLPETDSNRQRYERRLALLKNPAPANTSSASSGSSSEERGTTASSEEKERSRSERLREKMASLTKKETTTPATKPPPSLDDYFEFRTSLNEKSEKESWKQFSKDLPGATAKRRVYVNGWFEGGKTLRRLMKVDAVGDADGTFTFFYWSQGWLTSVYRVRRGAAVPVEGVKKATDTYNFFNGKMVSWKRTQDDAEKVEDPKDPEFEAVAKRVIADGEDAAAPLLEMAKKQ